MIDFPDEDRELLAAEYDKGSDWTKGLAEDIRNGVLSYQDECALHAIAKARKEGPSK